MEKPQLSQYLVTSRDERKNVGVSSAYVDDYNQAKVGEYNNDYNYWAWLQQQEYNSPVNQRKRLEEAGLNPNFQAVDSGNVSAPAASQVKVSGKATESVNRMINSVISPINALLQAVGQGVDTYSKISNTPKLSALSSYRDLVTEDLKTQVGIKQATKVEKQLDNIFNTAIMGGNGVDELGVDEVRSSPRYTKFLRESGALAALISQREGIVNNLQPAQVKEIYQRMAQSVAYIKYLESQMSVNGGRIDLMKVQEGFYKSSEYLNYTKQMNIFEHTINLQEQRNVIKESANKLRQEIRNLGQAYNINIPRVTLGENYLNNAGSFTLYHILKALKAY